MNPRTPPLLLALTLPAYSQSPFDDPNLRVRPWQASAAGAVTACFAAEVTGDMRQDLVLLDGTQLVLAYSPSTFTSFTAFGVPANHAARFPGAGVAGPDAILAVGAGGCHVYRVDYSSSPYVKQSTLNSLPSVLGGWRGATRVVAARSGGEHWIVGVHESGSSLLRIEDPLGANVSHASISVGAQVFDLLADDFDGDGHDELAVLAANGAYSIEVDGTLIRSFPFSCDGGHLASVRPSSSSHPEAVAVVDLAGSAYLAAPADGTGGLAYLGADRIEDLMAAELDLDANGAEDLVLAMPSGASQPLCWIPNLGGGTTSSFSAASMQVIEIGEASNDVGVAAPALADFDQDGDIDVAQVAEGTDRLVIAENGVIDSEQMMVSTVGIAASVDWEDLEENLAILEVLWSPPAGLPFTPDGIQVEQWVQETDDQIAPLGAQGFSLDLPPTGGGPWNDTASWQSHAFQMQSWPGNIHLYTISYFAVRLVEHDAQGEVIEAGPSRVLAVTLWDEETEDFQMHHLLAIMGGSFSVVDADPEQLSLDPLDPPPSGPSFLNPDFHPPYLFVGNYTKGSGGGELPTPPPMQPQDPDPPVPPPGG